LEILSCVVFNYTHEFLVCGIDLHIMSSRKDVSRASGMDYLHERAEESRHNEILAYLMFMAGAIFFVGGLIETVVTTENPDWFLFFPYKITPHAYSLLGLSMVLSGFTLLVLGIVLGVHYSLDRAVYLSQLKEVYADRVSKEWNRSSASHELKDLSIEQLKVEGTNDLKECTKYLIEQQGLGEADAKSYCEMLGNRWRELVESNEET
jgi:cytochrome b subunit of formate dehydrogenase